MFGFATFSFACSLRFHTEMLLSTSQDVLKSGWWLEEYFVFFELVPARLIPRHRENDCCVVAFHEDAFDCCALRDSMAILFYRKKENQTVTDIFHCNRLIGVEFGHCCDFCAQIVEMTFFLITMVNSALRKKYNRSHHVRCYLNHILVLCCCDNNAHC